jgi:thymidylate synthase ThyX
MITAKVIADSISPEGKRLTTIVAQYPRFIHAELMTHRAFSRNASSSRAVPVKKALERIKLSPARPTYWGRNQAGMQAREQHEAPISFAQHAYADPQTYSAPELWHQASEYMCNIAACFAEAGYHKQTVNRLTEPFQHIQVLISATEWDNFFALRNHPDAQPEMQELAAELKKARDDSSPTKLYEGAWHLPFIDPETMISAYESHKAESTGLIDNDDAFLEMLRMISAARCARVSYYLNERNSRDDMITRIYKDLELAMRLSQASPMHASPFEHQATPFMASRLKRAWMAYRGIPSGENNFRGWRQYRSKIEGLWT